MSGLLIYLGDGGYLRWNPATQDYQRLSEAEEEQIRKDDHEEWRNIILKVLREAIEGLTP